MGQNIIFMHAYPNRRIRARSVKRKIIHFSTRNMFPPTIIQLIKLNSIKIKGYISG